MIETMKALTLWQPWASLIAVGAKHFETRSWVTSYRGPIAVHAAVKPFNPLDFAVFDPKFSRAVIDAFKQAGTSVHQLPFGAFVATAELVECWDMKRLSKMAENQLKDEAYITTQRNHGFRGTFVYGDELLFGDWTPGRYAWELANVKMLDIPIPAKGKQGLWNWTREEA